MSAVPTSRGSRHLPRALERRILLDAAAVATGVDAMPEASDAEPVAPPATQAHDARSAELLGALGDAGEPARREAVVIDGGVENHEALAAAVADGVPVLVLDPDSDGLAQIADWLDGQPAVDALHVLSHGRDGAITLGNLTLADHTLADASDALARIGDSLTASGDLLFYGCDVAGSEHGEALLADIAALTGADVAASDDLTGAEALGGDWILEASVGEVESAVALDEAALAAFDGALAAVPTVSVSTPGTVLLGEAFDFTVQFDNTSPSDSGFGPFVDVFIPRLGTDGAYNPVTDTDTATVDGITFNSASFNGTALTVTSFTIEDIDGAAGIQYEHPLAKDTAGAALQVTAPAGVQVGDTVHIIQLPFGSFAPDQPVADITVNATLSNLADLGTPLTIQALAGYQFGNTPAEDTASDPSFIGTSASATVTPELVTITSSYGGDETETPTGPNFPQTFTISVDVANGQTLTSTDITNALPPGVVFLSASATGGGTVTTAPPVGTPTTAANNDLVVNFPSITGGAGADAVITVNYFVPDVDGNGTPIIPANGNDVGLGAEVSALGDWTPIDTRDPGGTDNVSSNPAGVEIPFTAKSLTIAESVAIDNDTGSTGATPGDTLAYTASFSISDYFAYESIVVTDVISDGQLFDGTFTPTLTVNREGTGATTINFDVANFTVVTNKDNNPATPATDGTTTVTFNVSQQLIDSGIDANGRLFGGLVATGNGAASGGTTGSINFKTVIQESFTDNYPVGGEAAVNENDAVSSSVTISANVLDGALAVVDSETDDSGTSTTIVAGGFTLDLYAKNNVVGPVTAVQAGDEVTYRLRYTLQSGDFENFQFTQYLPIPLLRVGDPDANDPDYPATPDGPAWSQDTTNPVPQLSQFAFGPEHSAALNGNVPTVSVDTVSNSINFNFGDRQDPGNQPLTIDLLFTAKVTTDPFADGLFLTQQALQSDQNTQGSPVTQSDLLQFQFQAPKLDITKGVVSVDRAGPTFNPGSVGPAGITFATAGTNTASFTGGIINSTNLAAGPIDSDVDKVDGGDTVRFAVVVENVGSASGGAFDVSVRDLIPTGFEAQAGNFNFQVRDGAGNALAFTDLGGGPAIGETGAGLFGNGIVFDDAPGQGALRQGVSTSGTNTTGTNIAIITYDLVATSALEVNSDSTTRATLFNYSSGEGGSDFTPDDFVDSATVGSADPAISSAITATSQAHTVGQNVTVGETVTVTTTITVPEGQSSNARLVELLDPGLAIVSVDSVTPSAGLTTSVGTFANVQTNATIDNPASGTNNDGRRLTLDFGTVTNTNNDGAAETIVVQYTAVVLNSSDTTTPGTGFNSQATWSSDNSTVSDSTTNVTLVEPSVAVTHDVSPAISDAGDTVTYTITITSGADADAFDVNVADIVPAGVTYTAATLTHTGGIAPTTSSDAGGNIALTYATLAKGETSTITFQATVDSNVAPGQTVQSTANVDWSTLAGVGTNVDTSTHNSLSDERTGNTGDQGGALNDLTASDNADLTIQPLDPVLTLVDSSESGTTGTNVAVGEIVRYRLEMKLAEGQANDLEVTAAIPAGLAYIADGTTTVALVSSGGASVTSNVAGLAGAGAAGDELTVSGITPTTVLPTGNISGGPFNSNTDVTFDLGDVTNADSDANQEFVVIEFNARVVNETGIDRGDALSATASVSVDGIVRDTSPAVAVTVVEPDLSNFAKRVVTSDASTVTYQITVSNTGDGIAHEARILDVLDTNLTNLSVTGVTLAGGAAGTTDSTAGTTLDVLVDSIPPGGSVTVTYTADLVNNTLPVPNDQADITWTSLDGTGTGLGASTHGAAGSATGERDGSGGVNDHAASDGAGVGTVTGQLYEDINRNGTRDAGERIFAGVDLDVLWAGPDGVFGNGDDVALTATTDANGVYTLGGIPAGNVRVSVQTGDLPGAPVGPFAGIGDPQGVATDSSADLVFTEGEAKTDQDFRYLGPNDAPTFANLDNTPSYTENLAPQVLDADATIADQELDLIGNYGGATLTINRQGGANAQDVFGSTGTLAALTEGGTLTVGGTAIGTVTTNSGGTLLLTFDTNATPALVDQVLQQITYENSSDDPPTSVTLDVNINDRNVTAQGSGGALDATGNITVAITPVNDVPVVTGLTGDAINYTEDQAPQLLDAGSNATIADPDSGDFDGGTVTVSVTAGGDGSEDRFSISNVGGVTLSGGVVSVGGTAIGTVTGGTGGADLVVTLNANANTGNVQALVRALNYDNTDTADPTPGTRNVSVTVTDGDGGAVTASTLTVTVQDVNDAPAFAGLDNTPAFTEGPTAQVLDPDATLSDEELDAFGNYDGATLTVARQGGASTEDVFANTGTLGALTAGGALTVGGTTIGTVTTNSGGTLVFTFNASATPTLVDQALQQITYRNSSDTPPANVALEFDINDRNAGPQGSGGALNATGVINVSITAVNDAPSFTGLDNTPMFTEGGGAQVIDSNATIADPELEDAIGNYGGATLSISRNGGASGDDVFANTGTLGALTQGGALTVGGTTIGTVTTNAGGTLLVTFNTNATPALVDQVLQQITYENSSDDPPTGVTLDVTINDGNVTAQGTGGALASTQQINVGITPVNDVPAVANLDGDAITYNEEQPIQRLDSGGDATVGDPDSGDFNGGTVTVSITAGGDNAEDRLSIDTNGTGVTVVGGVVSVGGTAIGTVTGGTGGADLVVTLNASANPANVQTLVRALGYDNTDTVDPTPGARNVAVTVTDGDGGAVTASNVTVTVQDVNEAPTFTGLDATPTFVEDMPAVVLDADATIADEELDGFGNYNGATLTVARQGGANGEDQFTNSGNLGALTEGGALTVGGTTIGTVTTNSGGTLVFTFNTSATPALVDQALQQIAYSNSSDTPPANVAIEFDINDRNAGPANPQGTGGALDATGVINVSITPTNDVPAVGGLAGDVLNYTEDQAPQLLDAGGDATVGDPDSGDFDGGTVTVSVTAGGDGTEDRFSISNVGGVTVSGGVVSVGGTAIGTVTGGTGGTDLVVTLNANANPTNVQALVRALNYDNTDTADPTPGARTVDVTVTDGDGGAVTASTVTVNVQDVNEAPAFAGLDNAPTLVEGNGPLVIDADATISDEELDTFGNYAGATLTITRQGGASAEDVFANTGTLGALTQGGALTVGGTTIGTVTTNSAGTLVVTFNAAATPALVDQVLQQITYDNNSDTPPANVALDVTINDQNAGPQGSGGALGATGTINIAITPVNDAPSFVGLDNTPTYTEGTAGVVIDGNATIADPELEDSIGNYGGATLTLVRQGGASGDDVFENTGTLGALTEGGPLVVGGTTIGTVTTNSGGSLVVTFNTNATPALVDQVLQQVTYRNSSVAPPPSINLDVTIDDRNTGAQGTGGALDATTTLAVNITPFNSTPTIGGLDNDAVTFTEGDAERKLDGGAPLTLTDIDSPDFDGGEVRVAVTGGGFPGEDVYTVSNEGTGPGQIGLDGTTVTFGGVAIGTVTGGTNGADLVVSLNGNASVAAVEALLRNLSYQSTAGDDPTAGTRNTVVTVSDGDGATSAQSRVDVTVVPVNDPPTITSIPNQVIQVGESTAALPFTVGDPESPSTALTVTAVTADGTVLPASSIIIQGTGANRTITIDPPDDLVGDIPIRITVSDGALSTSTTMTLTVLEPAFIQPDGGSSGSSSSSAPSIGTPGNVIGAAGAGAGGAGGGGATVAGAPVEGPRQVSFAGVLPTTGTPDGLPELRLEGDVEDRIYRTTDEIVFSVPENAFQTEGGNEIVAWEATLADGSPLPGWLSFDPDSRTFTGSPPDGQDLFVDIAVKVRDDFGNEAVATFTLTVREEEGQSSDGASAPAGDGQQDTSPTGQDAAADGEAPQQLQQQADETPAPATGKTAVTADLANAGEQGRKAHAASLLHALEMSSAA